MIKTQDAIDTARAQTEVGLLDADTDVAVLKAEVVKVDAGGGCGC